MRAARAFLGYVEVIIEEDGMVRTGIHTTFAASAFNRIQDDQAIFPLVDGIYGTGLHAGGIITVIAKLGNIIHLDLGNSAANMLIQFQPELAGIRLRPGIRRPIIGYMFILAGYLTAIAAVADRDIYHKNFLFVILFSHFSLPLFFYSYQYRFTI
jgi:hypothetical protein